MSVLTFDMTADPHARDVRRDGDKLIGSIQWHEGSAPRFVSYDCLLHLTLIELELITLRLQVESNPAKYKRKSP